MMLHHIYYLSALLLALCIIITRPIQVEADSALVNAAQRMKLPDSIDVTSSTKPLRVELNGNVVKPGDQIPAKNFKSLDINKITWEANSVDALFTLVLLDLDRKPASGNGTNVYNQFTSFNIPGNSIMNGQSIVAIEPPHVPCQPSLKHRLALLLFHQRESIDIPDVAYMSARAGQSQKRENFKLDNFMRQHRLDLYGANVFHAIGESSGICSGSSTIHSLNTYTHLLVAMVTVVAALGFISGKQ